MSIDYDPRMSGSTDFELSAASTADYPAFARLFTELAVPEAAPSAKRFAEAIAPDAMFLREREAVIGYAWARRRGDSLHVVHVVVAASHRGRGAGRALMNAVAARGRALGLQRWMLNVKPENLKARALYERCGMCVVHESASIRFAWAHTSRLANAPSVTTRVLAAADDEAFETALSLSRGELDGFRTTLARTVVGGEVAGAPVGVLAFDPSLPGASPFRLRAPEHARPLLEALRPHSRAEHDFLFAFVEGDPALESCLLAAGGRAVMRALRMEGEISA